MSTNTLNAEALEAAVSAIRAETFNALTMDECRDAASKAISAYLAALSKPEPVALGTYDAGLLNDYCGDVNWWQDYIRGELARAHEFYADQFAAAALPRPSEDALVSALEYAVRVADYLAKENYFESADDVTLMVSDASPIKSMAEARAALSKYGDEK